MPQGLLAAIPDARRLDAVSWRLIRCPDAGRLTGGRNLLQEHFMSSSNERVGLYEELLTERLRRELAGLRLTKLSLDAKQDDFDEAKLRDLLETACGRAVHNALTAILLPEGAAASGKAARMEAALSLADALLGQTAAAGLPADVFERPPEVLLAADQPAAAAVEEEPFALLSAERPITKFTGTSLLTGESNDVRLQSELFREIQTADRIDWLVSFIKDSGVRKLLPALERFAERGGRLRVLTTTYTGATELDAVVRLASLPHAEVRIAYEHQRSPMHAKAYLFSRPHGLDTAYVGSANLSESAQTKGLEWTMKLSERTHPAMLEEMHARFDGYFDDVDKFVPFDPKEPACLQAFRESQRAQRDRFAKGGGSVLESMLLSQVLPMVDLKPYPYQQLLLDKIDSARKLHREVRSLVVAATGTGKTMIAAFDYRAWRKTHPNARLLFVAHRAEILDQALGTFRLVLGDANFGARLDGANPLSSGCDREHLFLSVQTAARRGIASIAGSPEFFDYVVIDEFHHAAADTYLGLLTYLKPQAMLGLTATPHRADGQSIFRFFDRHAATAELPLATAIDSALLSPFEYWMLSDPVSLETAAWRSGGYDVRELEDRYTQGAQAAQRDRAVLDAVKRYLPQYAPVRAIGFCASAKHAEHMTQVFAAAGYRAGLVLGETPSAQRQETVRQFRSGELQFVFTVDVFNEGVDIPEVNAVLFLRPTASVTVFLQQLGRGLRLAEDKDALTVLDFVANANKKFSYEARLRALMMPGTSASVRELIDDPMPVWLPRGCSLQFEHLAREAVLKNLREYRQTDAEFIGRVEAWVQHFLSTKAPDEISLVQFLEDEGLTLNDWIKRAAQRGFSFTALLHRVRPDQFPAPSENLSKQSGSGYVRILRFNAFRTIERLLKLLSRSDFPASAPAADAALGRLTREERLALTALGWHWWSGNDMTQMTVSDPAAPGGLRVMKGEAQEVAQHLFEGLAQDPIWRRELCWALEAAAANVDYVSPAGGLEHAFGLELHADYALKAVGSMLGDPAPRKMMSGVAYIKASRTDCFFVTIRKDEKAYRAKVRYDDYAMNAFEFHWQSQSATAHASAVGRRYQRIDFRDPSAPQGLLFVREVKEDELGTQPFTFLGRVRYVRSWGDKPMSVIWALETKLPARLLGRFQR